jgi:hypothetical protein
VQIDVATFIQWVNARLEDRERLADFYRSRFRDEFQVGVRRVARDSPALAPRCSQDAFEMRQYRLKASSEADRLERRAPVGSEQAKTANQRADNYMLAVVLFASALFFAGIS